MAAIGMLSQAQIGEPSVGRLRRFSVSFKIRGADRNPKYRNNEIVRVPIRYSDGQQLIFSGQFRTSRAT